MPSLVMDPTWGALEEALAPQRRRMVMDLLAGKRGIDPGTVPVYGELGPEQPLNLDQPPATPGPDPSAGPAGPPPPPPGASPAAGAPDAPSPERVRRPLTIYETPYGPELRKAEALAEKQGKNYFGAKYGTAWKEVNRFTHLSEDWIRRSEGFESAADAKRANERTSENQLLRESVRNMDAEEARIRQERIQRVLAGKKRYARGTPLDRGEAGVWQPVTDNETGEVSWEEADIPMKTAPPKDPQVYPLGASGGVYFDLRTGRLTRIDSARTPEAKIPAAAFSAIVERVMKSVDTRDPNAMARAVVEIRRLRSLFEGANPSEPPASAPMPPPARGAAMFKRDQNGQLRRVR